MSDTGTTPSAISDLPSAGASPLFVSLDDHENGYKDVPVEYLGGANQVVRLSAPPRKASRRALAGPFTDPDDFLAALVAICLPEHLRRPEGRPFLDQLTPPSADLVEVTAFALAVGLSAQKKMEAAALEKMMASASSAPSSDSSPADGLSRPLSDGAGPSSSSAPPLLKSPP